MSDTIESLRARAEKAEADGVKDLADMRRFQARYIEADRARLAALAMMDYVATYCTTSGEDAHKAERIRAAQGDDLTAHAMCGKKHAYMDAATRLWAALASHSESAPPKDQGAGAAPPAAPLCDVCGREKGEIGLRVECAVCHLIKKPRGRSVALESANSFCDNDCPGYDADPKVGDLWPGELRWAFGYGVPAGEEGRCHRKPGGEDSDDADCYRLGYERLLKERQPAAGPPSPALAQPPAPQEGLFEKGARAMREEAARAFEKRAAEHRAIADKMPRRLTGDILDHGTESERYNRKRFSVQLNTIAQQIRALPIPEKPAMQQEDGALAWLRVVRDAFEHTNCDYCGVRFVAQDGVNEDCAPLHYAIGGVVRYLNSRPSPAEPSAPQAVAAPPAYVCSKCGSAGDCDPKCEGHMVPAPPAPVSAAQALSTVSPTADCDCRLVIETHAGKGDE